MALITFGNLYEFSVSPKHTALVHNPSLNRLDNFKVLSEISRTMDESLFESSETSETRGLALKSIELTEGFENFIGNIFKTPNEIYFLAWTWDLSDQPINKYPKEGTDPESLLIKLNVGKIREFIGEGIDLFPKRKVRGGIGVRIQIWESDGDVRNLGKVIAQTADVIQKSELNYLLSTISIITGVSGATITLVEQAAIQLTKLIGSILKANSNDYVDLFEGYYSADKQWVAGEEMYVGNSSKIVLNKY